MILKACQLLETNRQRGMMTWRTPSIACEKKKVFLLFCIYLFMLLYCRRHYCVIDMALPHCYLDIVDHFPIAVCPDVLYSSCATAIFRQSRRQE